VKIQFEIDNTQKKEQIIRRPQNMLNEELTMKKITIKFLLAFALVLIFTKFVQAQEEPGRIKQDLMKAVVKIMGPQNQSGDRLNGTGFLVSKEITRNGKSSRQTFLVTNKHMLGDWNIADGDTAHYYNKIDVFFYRTVIESGKSYKPIEVNLTDRNGKLKDKVRPYPKEKIDIAIIALDEELSPANRIDLLSFDVSYLLPFDKIISSYVGLGDQVFAMGYPLGITSVKNNYPIAKSSYLASLPGTELIVEILSPNRKKEMIKTNAEGKILLLDGLIVGGNSGSPVVLPAEIKSRVNPQTKGLEWTKEPTQNLVIGIVSSGWSSAGLTIAYSSDYILELIDLYLKETKEKSR
jgi:hypothetical protein